LRKAEEEPSQRFHELLSIEGTVSPKGPKPPEPLAQSISVPKRVARRDLLRPPSGDQVVQVARELGAARWMETLSPGSELCPAVSS
jgi:hypothetical protein